MVLLKKAILASCLDIAIFGLTYSSPAHAEVKNVFSPKVGDWVIYDQSYPFSFSRKLRIAGEKYNGAAKIFVIYSYSGYLVPKDLDGIGEISEADLSRLYIQDIDAFCKETSGDIEKQEIDGTTYRACKVKEDQDQFKWYAALIPFGIVKPSEYETMTYFHKE